MTISSSHKTRTIKRFHHQWWNGDKVQGRLSISNYAKEDIGYRDKWDIWEFRTRPAADICWINLNKSPEESQFLYSLPWYLQLLPLGRINPNILFSPTTNQDGMCPDIWENALLYNCAVCCVPMTKGCVHALCVHVLYRRWFFYILVVCTSPLPVCMYCDSLEALPIYVIYVLYLLCGYVLVYLSSSCVHVLWQLGGYPNICSYVQRTAVLVLWLCTCVLVLLESACTLISEVMERLPPAPHLRSRSLSRMVSALHLTYSWSSSSLSFIIYNFE